MKYSMIILTMILTSQLFGQWLGAGTAIDPYRITSPSDLATLASNVNAGNTYAGTYFKQMNDIDMNVSPYNTGTGWTPIGIMYSVYFSGTYQGDGRTISNLFINRPTTGWNGLFACFSGTVTDLHFTGANVTGKDYVGVLTGYNGGTVTNCSAAGSVAGVYAEGSGGGGFVGLLAGWNTGTLTNCHSSGTVDGENNYVGGLTGYNSSSGDVVQCYSSAAVTGPDVCGGLVGINTGSGSEVRDSYATGTVTSTQNYVGGLVGGSSGSILRCYATGAVSGVEMVGGLVGQVSGTVTDSYATGSVTATTVGAGDWGTGGLVGQIYYGGTISRCYATGNVASANYAGGLVGHIDYDNAESFITNCYARGTVSGYYSGGLVGYFGWGTVTNSYSTGAVTGTYPGGFAGKLESASWGITVNSLWNTTASGRTDGIYGGSMSGLTGKTTTEMKTLSTFTTAGWDFEIETGNGSNNYWDIDGSASINNGYPFLSWQNGGTVTMPVELSSFTAVVRGSGVEIRWNTAMEVDNLAFEVERMDTDVRSDGALARWKNIGTVEGHGTTNAPQSYSFTDGSARGTVQYRLKQIDRSGRSRFSHTVEVSVQDALYQFVLEQNYPNPFNPVTDISFTVDATGYAALKIFNGLGQEVGSLFNGIAVAGRQHRVSFNASHLPSGTYFAQLTFGNKTRITKMLLLR